MICSGDKFKLCVEITEYVQFVNPWLRIQRYRGIVCKGNVVHLCNMCICTIWTQVKRPKSCSLYILGQSGSLPQQWI